MPTSMIYTTLHSDLEKSSCSKTNTEFPNSVETEVLIIKLVLENTYYTQASLFFQNAHYLWVPDLYPSCPTWKIR